MLDRVVCFAWGRLKTDDWYLDNPYAAWIQLIQTSLEADPFLHRQSILANTPHGLPRHHKKLLARPGTRRIGKIESKNPPSRIKTQDFLAHETPATGICDRNRRQS